MNDKRSEHVALSIAIHDENIISDIMELSIHDFWNNDYKNIFQAIENLYYEEKEVNFNSVRNELKYIGKLNEKLLMDEFLEDYGFYNGASDVVNNLKNYTKKRQLIEISDIINKQVHNSQIKSGEIISNVDNILSEIAQVKTGHFLYGDNGYGLDRFSNKNEFVRTGIKPLDDIIWGLFRKKLHLLSARPGEGKSTFALNIANNVSKYKTVVFFNLEMSSLEIEQKLLSMESGIDSNRFYKPDLLSLEEHEKIRIAEEKLKARRHNLHIYDSIFDFDRIVNIMKKEVKKYDVGLVIIDYLQLIKVDGINEPRLQVLEVSRRLKMLTQTLNIPILALSQLNREAAEKPPKLHQLKESGSLEQDANMVFFLYHEPGKRFEEYEVIVAKNRGGRIGSVPIYFYKEISKFTGLYK